ncbi:unnamed protein product [Boreogadus saida]
MYKMAGVSPMLYWEETKGSASPPSYSDAIHLPAPPRPAPAGDREEQQQEQQQEEQQKEEEQEEEELQEEELKEEELKPKLCKMQKTPAGYGFHITAHRAVWHTRAPQKVVPGGAAHHAGLQDGDVVVEVNSVNVERSAHEEVVALVHRSGASLELLVASPRVYQRLRARGAPITPTLLGPGPGAQTQATVEPRARAGTPPPPPDPPARERTPSVSSASSEDDVDLRF